MLDYTRAILNKTKKDVDTALTVFRFGTQILYILYLIYMLFSISDIWYLYLPLLIISAAFLVFDLVTTRDIRLLKEMRISLFGNRERKDKLARTKKTRSNIRKAKFWISHSLKLAVLVSALYPIVAYPYSVHPINIVCATVMAFLWILQIMLEVFRLILEDRFNLFAEALHADIEIVTKPVNKVKNAFKRMIGKDVEEPEAPSKERVYLDGLVEERRAERAAEKEDARVSRKEKIADWLDARISGFKRKETTDTEDSVPVYFTDESTSVDDDV